MNASSNMNMHLARTIFAVAAALAASFPAGAQLFRAYVSSTGSDGNPCNLPSPCRLLPAALAAVADGGEIWMLDSANFNTSQVEVSKSVTILAIPGVLGSVVATGGGHGLNINTAGVEVTLRNLVIVRIGTALDGVNFAQGAELTVEGCAISNVTGNGINAQASASKLYVRNSVIRDVGGSGVRVGNGARAALSGVHIERAMGSGLTGDAPSNITVSDSVFVGNGPAGITVASSTSTIGLLVERTSFARNVAGLSATCSAPCTGVDVKLVGNALGFSAPGIAAGTDNVNLTLTLDRNTLFNNSPAIAITAGAPTIYTLGNNTFRIGADITGGVFTPLAAQ